MRITLTLDEQFKWEFFGFSYVYALFCGIPSNSWKKKWGECRVTFSIVWSSRTMRLRDHIWLSLYLKGFYMLATHIFCFKPIQFFVICSVVIAEALVSNRKRFGWHQYYIFRQRMNIVVYYQVFGMKSHCSLHILVPIMMPMKLKRKYQEPVFYLELNCDIIKYYIWVAGIM